MAVIARPSGPILDAASSPVLVTASGPRPSRKKTTHAPPPKNTKRPDASEAEAMKRRMIEWPPKDRPTRPDIREAPTIGLTRDLPPVRPRAKR